MNAKSIIAPVTASAFTALTAAPALAQEATPMPKKVGQSTKSRDEVGAEVKRAEEAGALERSGEAKQLPPVPLPSSSEAQPQR